tara:strand:+ start:91 stop:498 length:408 start_codon:yes stop_codon:yes gene_type:complete
MLYVSLKHPYEFNVINAELKNIYKSVEGKNHYYGVIIIKDPEILYSLNEYLQKHKPSGILKNIDQYVRFKFPTHYNKPKYIARKANGMPTVAQTMCEELSNKSMNVNVKLKVEGYVKNLSEIHTVIQCVDIREIA